MSICCTFDLITYIYIRTNTRTSLGENPHTNSIYRLTNVQAYMHQQGRQCARQHTHPHTHARTDSCMISSNVSCPLPHVASTTTSPACTALRQYRCPTSLPRVCVCVCVCARKCVCTCKHSHSQMCLAPCAHAFLWPKTPNMLATCRDLHDFSLSLPLSACVYRRGSTRKHSRKTLTT
jgi:hypothetical protein